MKKPATKSEKEYPAHQVCQAMVDSHRKNSLMNTKGISLFINSYTVLIGGDLLEEIVDEFNRMRQYKQISNNTIEALVDSAKFLEFKLKDDLKKEIDRNKKAIISECIAKTTGAIRNATTYLNGAQID